MPAVRAAVPTSDGIRDRSRRALLTHLLKDGELQQLDGHVGVLHVDGGTQSTLGVRRGQTDQRLQGPGSDGLGLWTAAVDGHMTDSGGDQRSTADQRNTELARWQTGNHTISQAETFTFGTAPGNHPDSGYVKYPSV